MAQRIEPDRFDAIAVSSGLSEVLIASALARAGKSVLVLDAGEAYGDSWASVSGGRLQRSAECSPGGCDAAPCGGGLVAAPGADGAAAMLRLWPGGATALAHRETIIDAAPKALYQAEPLVSALVAAGAQHYLDFRLLEGSYVHQQGRLRPVPASRAELFADRSLSLADKRALGAFLAACADAQQGVGRLQGAFDSRPLAQLLQAEGMPAGLQDMVLYGIAQADTPQQQQQQQQQQEGQQQQQEGQADTQAPQQQQLLQQQQPEQEQEQEQQQQQQQQQEQEHDGLLTAAHGLQVLSLYAASLGRYGGHGAFMLPAYGTASLPEAFVRLVAVRGGVTALRRGTARITLARGGPPTAFPQQQQQQQQQQQRRRQQQQHAAAGAATAGASVAEGDIGIELQSGQMLSAGAILVSSSAEGLGLAPALSRCCMWPRVARCAALLDGCATPGERGALLTFPPGALGGGAPAAVVRGLQLAPAHSVAPRGTWLLHLAAVLPRGSGGCCPSSERGGDAAASTLTEAALAERTLRPALEALALLDDAGQRGDGSAAPPAPAPSPAPQQQRRPRVLAACYYVTCQPLPAQVTCTVQRGGDAAAAGQERGGLLLCDPAPAGFAGLTATYAAAEAAYRAAFPDLPWLTDQLAQAAGGDSGGAQGDAAAAGTSGGGGGGAAGGPGAAVALDEGEMDAIDELGAALAALGQAPGASPAP